MTKNLLRRLLLCGALLAAVPVTALLVLLGLVNIPAGHGLIERALATTAGGRIVVTGLHGHVPGRLHIDRIALRDDAGTWLEAKDLDFVTSADSLLALRLHLREATAQSVDLYRLPQRAASRGSGHVADMMRRIDVDAIRIVRLWLAPALAGGDTLLAAEGHMHAKGDAIDVAVAAHRMDGPGTYQAAVVFGAESVRLSIEAHEPAHGPLAHLAALPGLGRLDAILQITGPTARARVVLDARAGDLTVSGTGTIAIADGRADVQLHAASPAVRPRPDLGWQRLALEGRWQGTLFAPEADVRFSLEGAQIGDVAFERLDANLRAGAGRATLTASLVQPTAPGLPAALLAARPLALVLNGRAVASAWNIDLSLTGAPGTLHGDGRLARDSDVEMSAELASVAPFAALLGYPLDGAGRVQAHLAGSIDDWQFRIHGALEAVHGTDLLARLIGPSSTFELAGRRRDARLRIDRAVLSARSAGLDLAGEAGDDGLDFHGSLRLSDLAVLDPTLDGSLRADIGVRGQPGNLGLRLRAASTVSLHHSQPGPIAIALEATGLPGRPAVNLAIDGRVDGAPLRFALDAAARAGGLHVAVRDGYWRSAKLAGQLDIQPGNAESRGELDVEVGRLADLEPFIGVPATGSMTGTVGISRSARQPVADFSLRLSQVSVGTTVVGTLALQGHIQDPLRLGHVRAQLHATGIGGGGRNGVLDATAEGPASAILARLDARWDDVARADAEVHLGASLDVGRHLLTVNDARLGLRADTLALRTPAHISFYPSIVVDQLVVAARNGTVSVAGRVFPTLDARIVADAIDLATLTSLLPVPVADGRLYGQATLSGSLTAPVGPVSARVERVRVRGDAGRGVPAADLTFTAQLNGAAASVDASVRAGKVADLHVSGDIPFRQDGPLDLRGRGTVSLAFVNPFIESNGRRVRGVAALDVSASGTYATPVVGGQLAVEHGDFRDYANGIHLGDVSLQLTAQDRSLHLVRFAAKAGSGAVAADGRIDILEPGVPLRLHVTAVGATPLTNDFLSTDVDADVIVSGRASDLLTVSGSVQVERADISIPNALPREVVVLDVRRPGGRRLHEPPRKPPPVGLDVDVRAERAVFVRGRGLDAEVGGRLHVTGTTAAPQVDGAFDLRRGSLALAGASLKFTRGEVSFNGSGARGLLDPTLDFAAESNANDVSATLLVGGYASAPTVTLTSTPDLPQDEILARLLFGVSAKQIAPLQMVSIGVALASLSGVTPSMGDPMAAMQRRLGLDRLSVGGGSGADANSAVLEAGRYVGNRVYVGATQSTTGITKFQAQVDLTRHLKLQTVVGNGSATAQGTTPQNDPGNTLSLLYQIEY